MGHFEQYGKALLWFCTGCGEFILFFFCECLVYYK